MCRNNLYFNPVLELKATFSPTSNLDASYYTESKTPSVGHLRSVIDDANPLNLRSGNPNLKVTHEHQLNVNYYKILPLLSASLQSGISLMIKRNPIVSNSRYFTETTYLREYNYTVERGATLHTYENSDPEYYLKVCVGFEKFWSFLGKCTFTPSYVRRVTPSFTQGEENDLTMNRGGFDVIILTNFSKKVSLTIISNSAFDHSTNQFGQSSKSLEERLTLVGSTKIIPKCSVNVYMAYNYRKNLMFQNEENNIKIPLKNMHGVVLITKLGGDIISNDGIFYGILLTAVISMNLAILNILPIPALDGGHLLFLCIEKILRKCLKLYITGRLRSEREL